MVDGKTYIQQLGVGKSFRPISLKRPARELHEVLLHSREVPFVADSPVQSIEVACPKRESFIAGTNRRIVYWFIVSLIAALAAKPFL